MTAVVTSQLWVKLLEDTQLNKEGVVRRYRPVATCNDRPPLGATQRLSLAVQISETIEAEHDAAQGDDALAYSEQNYQRSWG